MIFLKRNRKYGRIPKMKRIYSEIDWLKRQMPEGMVYPSSTIITGPAGAGKPLIGAMMVNDFLRHGIPLIYWLINFDRKYSSSLLERFNPDTTAYDDQIVYVEFDPQIEGVEKTGNNMFHANFLISENIDRSIKLGKTVLSNFESPPLIFGSALNMLLFSKTYADQIHRKIIDLLIDTDLNTMFTITNNIFEEQAHEWENAADNLFLCQGAGIMRLTFRILKMKDGEFIKDEMEVPLTEEELYNIRMEAEKARKHFIPMIRKI